MEQKKHSESMALASMILGGISLVTCSCIYISIVCGSLGVILGLLSRGGETSLHAFALTGVILSSIGLCMTLVIYAASFLFLLYQYGGIDGILREYETLYNAETLEEMYRALGI